ncbi:MAG: DUF4870 domain-containing protein [Bifidobacteriaceae bacterium]|jgi:uncharacterized membrane protein|nr:DUF4870 domain-containing protein [Bifidobacteriaceae bacterium]
MTQPPLTPQPPEGYNPQQPPAAPPGGAYQQPGGYPPPGAYPPAGQGYHAPGPPQGPYPGPGPLPPHVDVEQNKSYAILAYIGPLVLVPILAAKQSPFARYHANQGLVLFIGELAYTVVQSILLALVFNPLWASGSWGLYSALTGLLSLVWLFPLALAIIGIINAAKGECKPLPVTGNITILK